MYKISQAILSLLLAAVFLGACATFQNAPQPTPAPTSAPNSSIANPASVNCEKQGGKVSIQTRGDGGQFGVCVFEDNKQCEEWALFRGECPVGGLKITGYVTPAAQYCVITGGQYTITAKSNQANEQGKCAFKNGKTCEAADYYNGKCDPNN
jgi:putative hemolysin